MLLYADENFPFPAVEELRRFGHDVMTAQEDNHAGADDPDILRRANTLGRAILPLNRKHFERLHRQGAIHQGILSAKRDDDFLALAGRIHAALSGMVVGRWCLRVNRK